MAPETLSGCDDISNCVVEDDSIEGSGTNSEPTNAEIFDVGVRKVTNDNHRRNKTSVKTNNGTRIGSNVNISINIYAPLSFI